MRQTGLDESHILCVIANDNERLIIHEKFKQNYIVLARVIFIQNDPFSPGLKKRNRVYVWDNMRPRRKEDFLQDDDVFIEDSGDEMNVVENDFYPAIMRGKKKA
jgi:hypothetical protein